MGSGSVRKVLLDGISFYATADGTPEREPTQENEGIRHSGGVSKKVTYMNGAVSALKLTVTAEEYELLQELSERPTNFAMSYTRQNGDALRATGFITLANYSDEDNSIEITMTPETGRWELFAAAI
jgi:hypothetical protein